MPNQGSGFVTYKAFGRDLVYPRPARRFEKPEQIREWNTAWVRRFGLVDEKHFNAFQRIGCANCASWVLSGFSADIVCAGADLIAWLFLFDDEYVEALGAKGSEHLAPVLDRFLTVMRQGAPVNPADPYERAIVDLRDRTVRMSSVDWWNRFQESIATFFDGGMLEAPWRQTHSTPRLDAYRKLRSLSIGALPVYDLIELGLDSPLPPHVLSDPAFHQMREQAAIISSTVNDLYSFRKELRDGDPLNLVAVLMHCNNLDESAALDTAVRLHNDDANKLSQMVEQFVTQHSKTPAASRYADALLQWIAGNAAWTPTCGRYEEDPSPA